MELTRAVELLRILADGIDPLTGELLPQSSICNQADIVRALHCVLNAVEHPSRAKNQPENAGKPWDEAELDQLEKEFQAEMPISQIAKEHKRTRGAIEAKLGRLGLIEDPYARRK